MDVNIENRDRLLITILQDGYCPYCSKGRFKNVLAHISKIHGIKAVELKDSLGLTRRHSFTSETTKHKQRESAKSTKRIKNLTIKGVTKKHSEIAKAKMSQTKLDKMVCQKIYKMTLLIFVTILMMHLLSGLTIRKKLMMHKQLKGVRELLIMQRTDSQFSIKLTL